MLVHADWLRGGPQPLGQCSHEALAEELDAGNEDDALDQGDPAPRLGQQAVQQCNRDPSQDRPPESAGSPDQACQYDQPRQVPAEIRQGGELKHQYLQPAGQPRERCRQRHDDHQVLLHLVAQ